MKKRITPLNADAYFDSLVPRLMPMLDKLWGPDWGDTVVTSSTMIAEWGERCPDYEEGCACCEAWKRFDMGLNPDGDA